MAGTHLGACSIYVYPLSLWWQIALHCECYTRQIDTCSMLHVPTLILLRFTSRDAHADHTHLISSTHFKYKTMQLKWVLAPVLGTVVTALWLSTTSGGLSASPVRWLAVLLLPVAISGYGMRRKSLDFSGGMLAVLVGFILTAASACFVVALLVFFLSSSRLTKWKGNEKRKFEADYKEGKGRHTLRKGATT